jgi:4,5-dihydroxyphthalate decarboxylase
MVANEPVTLHTLLGNHPNTKALKSGALSSSLVKFDYFEVKVANTQFKALVRDAKYDCGELAMVTFLQAEVYGKPYVLLPATIVGRNQHHTIFYNTDRGHLKPSDLNGKRVGGFLAEDYGVDCDKVTWVTFEDAHLAEYRDPPNVQRAPEGKVLKQMLIEGEIDAAILGDVSEDGPIRHLIPDYEEAGRKWARAHGGVPINHLCVMRESIVRERPDVVREVYRLLKESRMAADLPTGPDAPLRFGIGAVRQSLAQLNAYAAKQHLIPHEFSVDDLFADAARILGAEGA